MSSTVGYDPLRIIELRNQTQWAIGALHGISVSDPAAGAAVDAITGMHRVLDDQWMAAITEIQRRDPLARPGRVAGPVLGPPYTPTPDPIPPRPNKFSGFDNIELIYELRRAQDVTLTSSGRMADLDHVYWESDFPELAEEIAHRATIDLDFGFLLRDMVETYPIIGMATGRAEFPPDLIAQLLSILVTYPINRRQSYPGHLDAGTNALLEQLLDHPQVVLQLLGDEDFTERLLTSIHIDHNLVGAFLQVGLVDAVADNPSTLGDALEALSHTVQAANTDRLDRRGFSPPVAQSLAVVIAAFGPAFLGGLKGESRRVKARSHQRYDIDLGSESDFDDFFGAIIRDPVALGLLLGFAQAAARLAIAGDSIRLDTVTEFSQMIDRAAQNENLELELDAQSQAATIGRLFDIFDVGLVNGLPFVDLSKLSLEALKFVHSGIETWTKSSVDAETIGVEDVHRYVSSLIKVEILRDFFTDPVRHGGVVPSSAAFSNAHDLLRDIDRSIANGATLEDLDEVVPALEDLLADFDGEQHFLHARLLSNPDPSGAADELRELDE